MREDDLGKGTGNWWELTLVSAKMVVIIQPSIYVTDFWTVRIILSYSFRILSTCYFPTLPEQSHPAIQNKWSWKVSCIDMNNDNSGYLAGLTDALREGMTLAISYCCHTFSKSCNRNAGKDSAKFGVWTQIKIWIGILDPEICSDPLLRPGRNTYLTYACKSNKKVWKGGQREWNGLAWYSSLWNA